MQPLLHFTCDWICSPCACFSSVCDSSSNSIIQSAFSHLLQTIFKTLVRFAHGLVLDLDLKEGKIFSSVKVKVRLFCIYSRGERPVKTCSCMDFSLTKLPGVLELELCWLGIVLQVWEIFISLSLLHPCWVTSDDIQFFMLWLVGELQKAGQWSHWSSFKT